MTVGPEYEERDLFTFTSLHRSVSYSVAVRWWTFGMGYPFPYRPDAGARPVASLLPGRDTFQVLSSLITMPSSPVTREIDGMRRTSHLSAWHASLAKPAQLCNHSRLPDRPSAAA